MEYSYREGEVVGITLINEDSNGKVMSEVVVRWFGMDNSMANMMAIDVVTAIAEKTKEWEALKKEAATEYEPKGSIR